MDSSIELNMDEIMNGVRNTSGTIRYPKYLSCSRKMERLQGFMQLDLIKLSLTAMPRDIQVIFEHSKISHVDNFNQEIPQAEECK